MEIPAWILTAFIPIVSLFLSVLALRPNLRVDLSFIKQKVTSDKELYPNQYIVFASVSNNGLLGIKYRIMNQAEMFHKKGLLDIIRSELHLTKRNIKEKSNKIDGIYSEIVRLNNKECKNNKIIHEYMIKHKVKAGEISYENHIVGQVFLSLDSIDYIDNINSILWETWIDIIPTGFWGLPIIKILNYRRVKISNAYLIMKTVDKSI